MPFLRGKQNRNEKCYGIFALTRSRFFGICGAQEDYDNNHRCVDGRQLYGHVEGEGIQNEAGNQNVKALGEEVELS